MSQCGLDTGKVYKLNDGESVRVPKWHGVCIATSAAAHLHPLVCRRRPQVAPMPSLDTPGDDNKRDSPA